MTREMKRHFVSSCARGRHFVRSYARKQKRLDERANRVEGEEGEVDRLRGKPEDLVDIVGGGRVARDRADESDVGRMDSVAAEDIDVWSRGEVRRGGHGDAEFL